MVISKNESQFKIPADRKAPKRRGSIINLLKITNQLPSHRKRRSKPVVRYGSGTSSAITASLNIDLNKMRGGALGKAHENAT